MKKIVSALVSVLILLIGMLFVINVYEPVDFYKIAEHVNYKDISKTDGTNLYYFYQETCLHCNNIKDDVANFYEKKDENINLFLVDAAKTKNSDVWFTGDASEFKEPSGDFNSYKDIKIQGTPTLIEIKDGKITKFLVGEDAIPAYLNKLLNK